jgi:hypothetical protein
MTDKPLLLEYKPDTAYLPGLSQTLAVTYMYRISHEQIFFWLEEYGLFVYQPSSGAQDDDIISTKVDP